MKKQNIYIIVLLIVLAVFLTRTASIGENERNYKLKGFPAIASSSTNYGNSGNSCSGYAAKFEPVIQEGSEYQSMTLDAATSSGRCAGQGATARTSINLGNPNQYSQIFIDTSGFAETNGYTCEGASAALYLQQDGSEGVNLASASSSEGTAKINLAEGILIKIDNGYATIPSISTSSKINENDLIIFAQVQTSAGCANRFGHARLNIENIDATKTQAAKIGDTIDTTKTTISKFSLSSFIQSIIDFIKNLFK